MLAMTSEILGRKVTSSEEYNSKPDPPRVFFWGACVPSTRLFTEATVRPAAEATIITRCVHTPVSNAGFHEGRIKGLVWSVL